MRTETTIPRLTLSGLLLLNAACVTNPITGRSQAMVVSDAQAAQQSALAYNQVITDAQQKKTLDADATQLARVKSIATPIIAQAAILRPETRNWQWDIHVLASNEVNAWCMAGGKVAVYTGLLDSIRPTDDELAAVLGHEIAHALLSHQAEKLSRTQMQQAGIGIGAMAAGMMGYNLGSLTTLADSIANIGLQLPNSRQAESEADSVGIELAAKAGFNPEAAVSLWQKMIQVGSSNSPDWLSTHPNPQSRIDAMQKKARELMPIYEASQASKADASAQPSSGPH